MESPRGRKKREEGERTSFHQRHPLIICESITRDVTRQRGSGKFKHRDAPIRVRVHGRTCTRVYSGIRNLNNGVMEKRSIPASASPAYSRARLAPCARRAASRDGPYPLRLLSFPLECFGARSGCPSHLFSEANCLVVSLESIGTSRELR